MKKVIILISAFFFGFTSFTQAGNYYYQAVDSHPQVAIFEDGLSIWGSAIESATGFTSLSVTTTDVGYDTIKAWYATILTCRALARQARIVYDDSDGKITLVIPL